MQDPKFIDVNGIATRYFEAGQGEPVVLVHGGQFGWFNCATDWDLNFDGLANDFRVFALDRIGQGHSDNPRDPSEYLLGTASQHLYDFMQAVGLERAHLIGHSRGGYGVTRVGPWSTRRWSSPWSSWTAVPSCTRAPPSTTSWTRRPRT